MSASAKQQSYGALRDEGKERGGISRDRDGLMEMEIQTSLGPGESSVKVHKREIASSV